MRRVGPLTLRGLGALVVAVACFVLAGQLAVPELTFLGLFLLLLVAASFVFLRLGRRSVSIQRAFVPDVVAAGESVTVRVIVTVRSMVPGAPGHWIDTLPLGIAGDAYGALPATESGLRAGAQRAEVSYSATGRSRGIHTIGPFALELSDPFGLSVRRQQVGERSVVTVVPPMVELVPISDASGASSGSQHTVTEQMGQGSDNLIARPYMPGDSMRRVHWRATAHLDALMVRQEEQESVPEATVLIDRSALRYTADATLVPGSDPGFEAAIVAAVSAARRLSRDGFRVEVIDAEGTLLADPLSGSDAPDEVESMLLAFAVLRATRTDALEQAPALFGGSVGGPLVIVTGRVDAADAAALTPLVRHASHAVLLSVAPVAGALALFEEAGWRCAAIAPGTDLATAWAEAESGARHGARQ